MSRLTDRVALITGGASGIGKATAFRFVNEGAKVVISDIQDAKGAEVEKELKALGADAMYLHHDVSSEASWKEVLTKIQTKYGGLDILFNNAGIGDTKNIEETSMEDYLKTIAVTQNSVHPGFIDTPILGNAKETEFGKVLLQVTPMNRLGLPEEVAAGVAYLASDDASFVTGSELVIDGGYLAR